MEFIRFSLLSFFFIAAWGRDLSNLKTSDNDLHPWIINVKVADCAESTFYGGLEFDLVFTDSSELKVTLPLQEFARSTKYSFNVQLASVSQLQYAVVRTVGVCSNSVPVDVLLLDLLQFQSETTKTSYVKTLDNVAIKDKCQNVRGTVLNDFEELSANQCHVNGQTYDHNEWFNMDCNARCRCVNGKVGCNDMCPKFASSLPKPDQTCKEVNVVGKCCPSIACVNDLGQKVTRLTRNRTTTDTTECKLKNLEKTEDDYTHGYPSMVFVCDEQCERSRFNAAVIVNNKWVMMYGNESWDQTNSFVHVTRPSVKPLRFKIEKAIKHENENLILLQISEYLPNTLQVQPVNLPVTKNHCENLIATGCSLINPSWKEANGNSVYSEVQSLTLNKGEYANRNLCNLAELDKSALCLALTPESCSTSTSGPIFVSDGHIDFFLGMQSSKHMEDNVNCRNRGVTSGVSICTTLDWIRTTIAN